MLFIIRQEREVQPMLRQTEIADDMDEEQAREKAHADVDGEESCVGCADEPTREQYERAGDGQRGTDGEAHDEAAEILDGREVDALDPDDQELEEECVRQRLRKERQRRPMEKRDGHDGTDRQENGNESEQRARHVFIILDGQAVREVARDDHREAARKNLREHERIDDRRDEEPLLLVRDARHEKEHLDAEHHARQQQERP